MCAKEAVMPYFRQSVTRLPILATRLYSRSGHVGLEVENWVLGQAFSEYFISQRKFSFYELLNIH